MNRRKPRRRKNRQRVAAVLLGLRRSRKCRTKRIIAALIPTPPWLARIGRRCNSNTKCIRRILDTHVTTGAVHDSQPYLEQLQRIQRHEIHVREAVADRGYGSAAIIRCLEQQGIETYIPLWSGRVGNSKYLIGDLVYEKENDRFRCPQGKYLTPNPAISENQKRYVSSSEDCRNCPQASTCPARTRGRSIQRFVLRSLDQDLFEEVQAKMRDPKFKQIQKERMWKSEGLFAEAKQNHNLSRAKYRGRPKVQIQALLSAIAQNVKRLVALFYCWLLSHWLRMQTKPAEWTASTNTLIDFFNTPHAFSQTETRGGLNPSGASSIQRISHSGEVDGPFVSTSQDWELARRYN